MSRELPILFSGYQVRAVLEGRMTQTRRIVKPQPPSECSIHYPLGNESWLPEAERSPLRHTWEAWWGNLFESRPAGHLCGSHDVRCPYGQPGDLLWVRETWASAVTVSSTEPKNVGKRAVYYRASVDPTEERIIAGNWHPSIFMRKADCRLWLRVEDVRVERLQGISEEDAKAEGVDPYICGEGPVSRLSYHAEGGYHNGRGYRDGFAMGWEEINGKRAAWESNPWVWVVTFWPADAPVSEVER